MTTSFLKKSSIAIALILLSLITGFSQIKTEGLAWQEARYWPRLEAVARGTAPAPDQYRLLTDRAVVATVRAAEWSGLPRPVGLSFVALRLIQNLLLFGLSYAFYRKLGIPAYSALMGLSALAWGMTQANYGSDLAFNAYTDILLYLAAAIVLLEGRYSWLIPVTALAALNRESSIFLPYMAVACALRTTPRLSLNMTVAAPALAAIVVWGLLFTGIHLSLGARPWALHESGAAPGLSMLRYNLTHGDAWGHTAGALGILPVLALLSWRGWHPLLIPLFWSVVPAWYIAHLFCAPLDQSRVLLLPQILVFIPGMLGGLAWWRQRQDQRLPGLLA